MSQEEGEKKKVSIADALDQLRQGKGTGATQQQSVTSQGTAALAATQRSQRIPPSYWLQNLQDSIQKRRDQLFDSLTEDASGRAGMYRRDLVASESFYLPADILSEVKTPEQQQKRVGDVSRFQDIEVLQLQASPEVVQETVQGPRSSGAVTNNPLLHRFHGVEMMDMSGIMGVEESGGAAARSAGESQVPAPGARFDGMAAMDFQFQGVELEEVQTEQQAPQEKKFKVNPMYRQMFQNLGKENKEGSE